MGRKLPGLVNRSGLRLVGVEAHVTISSELAGDALMRIDEIARSLQRGVSDLAPEEVTQWRAEMTNAAFSGDFFYAETAFVALASRD